MAWLVEWELDLIPDHTGSGVLHVGVADALAEGTRLSKGLVDVVLTKCLWSVDLVGGGSNRCLMLDGVLKEVNGCHGVKCK